MLLELIYRRFYQRGGSSSFTPSHTPLSRANEASALIARLYTGFFKTREMN